MEYNRVGEGAHGFYVVADMSGVGDYEDGITIRSVKMRTSVDIGVGRERAEGSVELELAVGVGSFGGVEGTHVDLSHVEAGEVVCLGVGGDVAIIPGRLSAPAI